MIYFYSSLFFGNLLFVIINGSKYLSGIQYHTGLETIGLILSAVQMCYFLPRMVMAARARRIKKAARAKVV